MSQNLAVIPVKMLITYHHPVFESDELTDEEFKKQDPDGFSREQRREMDKIDGVVRFANGPPIEGKVRLEERAEEGILLVNELKSARFVVKTHNGQKIQIVWPNHQAVAILNEGNVYEEIKAVQTMP